MNILMGTVVHNTHGQNIALALLEAGVLGAYYTGGVDAFHHPLARLLRRQIARVSPKLDSLLARRRVTTVPEEYVHSHWTWEAPRTLSSRMRLSPLIVDWFWEQSEHEMDAKCARLLEKPEFDAFFGTEFGSLRALRAARRLGKKGIVAFLSPHHATREAWVDAEYERYPELLTADVQRLIELARTRDARRDQEAMTADLIHTASRFTAQSLIDSGFPAANIINVPLGSPQPIGEERLVTEPPPQATFVYAGAVSVHKGVHYMLQAWDLLPSPPQATLQLFGAVLLPERFLNRLPESVVLHGRVPSAELFEAFRHASALVFPTLGDGFGMVVLEAMAHGLPVITTSNAGAAEVIKDGYNGFVVPPRSPEAIADRMEWFMRHPGELLAMRHNALATAERYTWRRFRATLRERLAPALGTPWLAEARPDEDARSS